MQALIVHYNLLTTQVNLSAAFGCILLSENRLPGPLLSPLLTPQTLASLSEAHHGAGVSRIVGYIENPRSMELHRLPLLLANIHIGVPSVRILSLSTPATAGRST